MPAIVELPENCFIPIVTDTFWRGQRDTPSPHKKHPGHLREIDTGSSIKLTCFNQKDAIWIAKKPNFWIGNSLKSTLTNFHRPAFSSHKISNSNMHTYVETLFVVFYPEETPKVSLYGKVDILLNNAGINNYGSFDKYTAEQFQTGNGCECIRNTSME